MFWSWRGSRELVRGSLSREEFARIYADLAIVTPLTRDCGELCQKVCCRPGDDHLGIYMLPGEEQLFTGKEDWLTWHRQDAVRHSFPPSWRGQVLFVRCRGDCPREMRPIQCRSFPLAPHLLDDGSLVLIWETTRLPYSCPLLTRRLPLQPGFAPALLRAWTTLIGDPLIADLVRYDSYHRERNPWLRVKVVYPFPGS